MKGKPARRAVSGAGRFIHHIPWEHPTSRYGENLYRELEQRGYLLRLLHPGQTHHFHQQRGLRAKTDRLDAMTIERRVVEWGGTNGLCAKRTSGYVSGTGALTYATE